jgi:selenocysteine lyase/cysteine desulfurase
VSFNVEGFAAGQLASVLSAEHGIGVRAGAFCAHRLTAHLTSGRAEPTAVRVSLGSFHGAEDVERFLTAIHEIIGCGPAWRYAGASCGFAPEPDPRPRPAFASLA